MSTISTASSISALGQADGQALLSAPEVILKGALEAETEVALLSGPRIGSFGMVLWLASLPANGATLREHAMRVASMPDAARGVAVARQSALAGRGAIALVPNGMLDSTTSELARCALESFPRGGAMCAVLEDSPHESRHACPRLTAIRMDLPCLEATSVATLRGAIDAALLISRASRRCAVLVVHASVLRAADTVDLFPNRSGRIVEVLHARRRPRARGLPTGEGGGTLRTARRLDLNHFRAMPSPGERVPTGFITVGPADSALMHLVGLFSLHGRVPILHLQMVHPLDDAAVGRLLSRCRNVVVLEPRPGTIEAGVLEIAERLRRRNEHAANVWGRMVPPDPEGRIGSIDSDDDLHPSMLARKITHLLEAIRPSAGIAAQFAPVPPSIPDVPPRGGAHDAATAAMRRLLNDVDQWLRERVIEDPDENERTALAIDGTDPRGAASRIVMVETWSHRRFQREGPATILQAARDDRPWMLVVCETRGEEIADLERLARGVIPADRADRVSIVTTNFNDHSALRQSVRDASLANRVTILIVQDGPPPQFDVAAIESGLAETDRLGFEARQRIVHKIDEICAVRRSRTRKHLSHRRDAQGEPIVRTEVSVEEVSERLPTRFRVRVRPLLEEVEVTRIKAPLLPWQHGAFGKLPTPQPVHGKQATWRAHIAGCRGEPPGVLATVLSEAARAMNYRVRWLHNPTSLGAGMRAWTQVLFTNPRPNEPEVEIATAIPYGEADLLLGLDAAETLRAIAADPRLRVAQSAVTSAVVNLGPVVPRVDGESGNHDDDDVAQAIAAVTSTGGRMVHDFASACRAWFDTDRVTDVAVLGAAYQLGCIPVSAEAIEAGLAVAESRGYARCADAFEFGRRFTLDPAAFQRDDDANAESTTRMARRAALSLTPGFARSRARRGDLSAVLQQGLEQMPGLAETDPGRQARHDFVVACHHCMIWGGSECAQTYADLITRLYLNDRGDTGRALTRAAVLPLADAILIRDPLYIAGLVASGEHRLRVRRRLHAKRGRGDEIDRRYLTRIDLLIFARRVRIDLRSSDWPARLADIARRFLPQRFRGSLRERALRDYIVEFVRRAIVESPRDYPRWADAMLRLHSQAAEDRLRGMAMAEVRMLTEASTWDAAPVPLRAMPPLPEQA